MMQRLKSRPGWYRVMMVIALLLAGRRAEAADQGERNALNAAARYMQLERWTNAESAFAQFAQKYPQSEFYGEAVLQQAAARLQMARIHALKQDEDRPWSYKDVITLLDAQRSRADELGDQFALLTARAYNESSNFLAAADAYKGLAQDFPNSTNRTEALYQEAKMRSDMGDTPTVIHLLHDPEAAFQQAVKAGPVDGYLVGGLFLLTETELARRDYDSAAKAIAEVPTQAAGSDLEWRRQYWQSLVEAEGGHPDASLQNSTNLLAAADDSVTNKAISHLLIGDINRKLERYPEAMASYRANLGGGLPVEQQRTALWNIVELQMREDHTDEAARMLADYLDMHPDDKGSDLNLLTLGELQLERHYQTTGDTNFLPQAEANFVRLIREQTNSEFWGKAQLDLGWCLWADGRIGEAGVAFSNAVSRLPHDEDQAVALFKLGDALYEQTNYPGAISSYGRITNEYGTVASVTNNLFEPALYQIAQAATRETNLTAASQAVEQLVKLFPDGLMGKRSMLLLGEAQDLEGKAEEARETLSNFVSLWPDSALKPEADLAIARTYEREGDWTNAVTKLYAWVEANTNHELMPEAEFQLAWAYDQSGNDARAVAAFTNYVAKYTNGRSAAAWLWLGRHDFYLTNQENPEYVKAELDFRNITNGTAAPADLQYLARLLAGKAAAARNGYGGPGEDYGAYGYFAGLANDSNCPPNLQLEAKFAAGDMRLAVAMPSNNACQNAIDIFADIATNHPGNYRAPLAWGKIGDCYQQLGAWGDTNAFALAINAYGRVMTATNADVATRSEAEYGIGQTLEKMAVVMPGLGRTNLMNQALTHYLQVFTGSNLQTGEVRDPFWEKIVGLAAARVETEELGDWDGALRLYQTLRENLPPLSGFLDERMAMVRRHLATGGP
jgi:TolA-binding protein